MGPGLGVSEKLGQSFVSSGKIFDGLKSPETEGVPIEGGAVEGVRSGGRVGSSPRKGCSGPASLLAPVFLWVVPRGTDRRTPSLMLSLIL
jgi:hypothetical protein